MTEDPLNPYAAPKSDVSHPVSSDMDAARHLLLKHEATAKSVGTLFILGSLFAIYVGGASLYYASLIGFGGQMAYSWLLIAMGLVQFWVALGLRKLNPKARIPGLIFGVLGLVSFFIVSPGAEGTAGNTVGIIITLYILYILGCDKGVRKGNRRHSAHKVQVPAACARSVVAPPCHHRPGDPRSVSEMNRRAARAAILHLQTVLA